MIKVLISAPSLDVAKNVSGVSSVVLQITRSLSPDVAFVHLEVGSEQKGGKLARRSGAFLKAARALGVALTAQYDILHSNTAMNPKSIIRDLGLTASARMRGKGVLLHIHGGAYVHDKAPPLLRLILKLLFATATHIVVLSRREKDFLTNEFRSIANRTDFIYNGVDLSGELTRTGDGRLDGLKVAFVGRLAPEKGLEPLIAACRSLSSLDHIAIEFFGDGELLPDVLALAQEKPFVTYRGVFHPSESRKVLRDFDALVLPSLRGEGMPMAVIEAMSVGATPICSPLSSIPEIVVDGRTGLLTAIGSADAIASAFRRLQRDSEGRRKMGEAALRFALANFDARKNYGQLRRLYQRISRRF